MKQIQIHGKINFLKKNSRSIFFTMENQVTEIYIKLEKILTVENLDREKYMIVKSV